MISASMNELTAMDALQQRMHDLSGMQPDEFAISLPYWNARDYKKGEFYNEYRNVCRYLGFINSGVFRIYKYDEMSRTERNMMFFSSGQFMTSFKSFFNQVACDYNTEAMTGASVLYIHYDKLQYLYGISKAWEHFGRCYAEQVLDAVLNSTEAMLFRTAEQRYVELMEQHPDMLRHIPLYHIASYLGIEGPSLSRIRKRLAQGS